MRRLRGRLPSDIAVPSSVALPFGTFERTLREKANAGAAKAIAALQKQLVRRNLGHIKRCCAC
jgi:hypothetical protein